jgi:hypothetical protein
MTRTIVHWDELLIDTGNGDGENRSEGRGINPEGGALHQPLFEGLGNSPSAGVDVQLLVDIAGMSVHRGGTYE